MQKELNNELPEDSTRDCNKSFLKRRRASFLILIIPRILPQQGCIISPAFLVAAQRRNIGGMHQFVGRKMVRGVNDCESSRSERYSQEEPRSQTTFKTQEFSGNRKIKHKHSDNQKNMRKISDDRKNMAKF